MAASTHPQQPPPAGPAPAPGGVPGAAFPRAAVIAVAAVVAGSAVLGLAAGFAWAALAPRALLVIASRGSADVVNPETSAFIAGDGWFVLVTAVAGVISGLLGYLLAVRRHGAAAMAGVLAGALAAALIARWAGEQPGAAAFHHALQAGRPGLVLRAPLMLGGVGALAFWPLAAGLTAGGFEAARYFRERRAMLRRQPALPAPPAGGLAAAWVPPLAPRAGAGRTGGGTRGSGTRGSGTRGSGTRGSGTRGSGTRGGRSRGGGTGGDGRSGGTGGDGRSDGTGSQVTPSPVRPAPPRPAGDRPDSGS
jgi:hypothetical protein